MSEIETRPGNWKRHICAWWGHENIGVRNLLHGTDEIMCLRCHEAAWHRPDTAGATVLPNPGAVV